MTTYGTLTDNREHALAWVNALRAEWNLKPIEDLRPGSPAGPSECTLAESLQPVKTAFSNDGTVLVLIENGSIEHELPEPVATFEHDFERGHYPDLIKDYDGDFFRPVFARPTAADAPTR